MKTDNHPQYDERFQQFGYNRMSSVSFDLVRSVVMMSDDHQANGTLFSVDVFNLACLSQLKKCQVISVHT